jgi:hypothetical protein
MPEQKTTSQIGTLNEKPLHEALKQWYAQPNDRFEVSVDRFIVDIVRGDLLIEIQTRNFAAIRRKLEKLSLNHPVRLVYPIPNEKWIIKQSADEDSPPDRRKSPKRGGFENVFDELIRVPGLLMNPNFSLELLLIQEEEVRRYDATRSWRRGGWVTDERRLLKVVDQRVLKTPADLSAFIPAALAASFTTADFAAASTKPRRLAQKMVYCLRATSCIAPVGKRGRAILYTRSDA